MNTRSALSTYRNLGAQTGVVDADPHRLIQMLLDGAMDRLAQARGAMQAGEIAAMGEALGKALGIIAGLRAALDHERGGEISVNLERLYDYMTLRLMDVHRHRQSAPIDEVAALLGDIRSGWDGIRSQVVPTTPQ